MKSKSKSGGLKPGTFKGLNPKKFGGGGGGNRYFTKRLPLKKGSTIPIMFLEEPDEFTESYRHVFKIDGKWNFVPCTNEDNCPLCQSEDEDVSGKSYFFLTNVFNMEEKKVQILEGGSNLATIIHSKYSRKPTTFMKRAYEVSYYPTTPASFGLELSEDDPLSSAKISKLKLEDINQYLLDSMKNFYGDDLDNIDMSKTSLDDDEDEGDDEDGDEYTVEDLMELSPGEVRTIAKGLKIRTTDAEGEKRTQRALARLIVKKQ